MARVVRRRTLHNNPGRRRRNMTDKQIAIFGSKAQKAALKHRRRKARHNAARRSAARVAAGRRSRIHRSRSRPRPRKRNPGELIELALNPAPAKKRRRRRKNVARSRSTKRSGRRRSHTTRRRSRNNNPFGAARRHRRRSGSRRRNRARSHRGRRRSNPAGVGRTLGPMVTTALWAIGGAAGSKFLTQFALGTANTGWIGYGANLAASFLLGTGVTMFLRNRAAGNAVILGGVIQTVLRVIVDKTPLGERLGKLGMGDYQLQGYLTPQRLRDGLHSADIDYPAAIMPAPAVVANGGMRGLGRRSLM